MNPKKEKKEPKYYKYRIDWVHPTPEMIKKHLKDGFSYRECAEIGRPIKYSAEHIHQIFKNKPQRVNKIVWDAIVAYTNVKEPQQSYPKDKEKAFQNKLKTILREAKPEKKKILTDLLTGKPHLVIQDFTQKAKTNNVVLDTTKRFLEQRRKLKNK